MASSRDVLSRLRRTRLPAEPVLPDPAARADPSASVLLVRPGEADGLEVWLMRRHARMAFAAGMAVFPGGRQEPADVAGPDPLRACAVRELAEETTVEVAPGDLFPWARWITPRTEPRRYDTWFYLAVLPPGARAEDVSGEADAAFWCRPADALARADAGELALMPPTRASLLELADHHDLASLLAAARTRVVEPVRPEVVRDGDGWLLAYPTPDDHDEELR
ncbi:8-oxo-dGTP pyrophosphatase MutT (NUDIX family) [Naumannella cuiyingiana]|uniref:8-oxo-dGTP pyrophosphatase MutT (NUDIX family) n=1 Tax=Naumannella cuiyingiana TaxID=1347891 RepID=A0A7Z0D9B2_9ACTN|nr:NUDIX hydrolase [Naumannella cuiyingiana]NYI71354.1 8-oxo-dGTP pyrophosphatase MutT (NUDIX family) [Naumannella cuiyingiana]